MNYYPGQIPVELQELPHPGQIPVELQELPHQEVDSQMLEIAFRKGQAEAVGSTIVEDNPMPGVLKVTYTPFSVPRRYVKLANPEQQESIDQTTRHQSYERGDYGTEPHQQQSQHRAGTERERAQRQIAPVAHQATKQEKQRPKPKARTGLGKWAVQTAAWTIAIPAAIYFPATAFSDGINTPEDFVTDTARPIKMVGNIIDRLVG